MALSGVCFELSAILTYKFKHFVKLYSFKLYRMLAFYVSGGLMTITFVVWTRIFLCGDFTGSMFMNCTRWYGAVFITAFFIHSRGTKRKAGKSLTHGPLTRGTVYSRNGTKSSDYFAVWFSFF